MILLSIFFNGVFVAFLALLLVNPEHMEFPTNLLLAIWLLGMIVVLNMAMFSAWLLYCVSLELTHEKIIFHFFGSWKLPINLHELPPIQIQERTIEGANAFGFADREYALYFIHLPNLPWYFRFAGFIGSPLWITKRGFVVTSWHANHEAFLKKMRAYEAQ